MFAIAVGVLVVDQVAKFVAISNLIEGEKTPFVGEALQLLLVRNSGAAFSLIANGTVLLTIFSVLAVMIILWRARDLERSSWGVMLGLLLGGVLGNLSDRLFREPGFGIGHVIDYLYTPWLLPAVYNLADVAILSSAVLMVILVFRGVPFGGAKSDEPVGSDSK